MAKAQGHITVRRRPKDGEQGEVGISYRVSFWQSGKKYHYDLNLTGGATERIIDICVNKPLSLIGDSGFKAYQCIRTHTSSDSIPLGNVNYWTAVNNFQPLVSPLILASKIVADFIDVDDLAANTGFISALTVSKLTVKDSNNNIIAKIGDMSNYTVDSVSGKYPFWIGGSTPANSVTRIDSTGKLTTTNIVASGGTIGGFSISTSAIGTTGDSYGSAHTGIQQGRIYIQNSASSSGKRFVELNAAGGSSKIRIYSDYDIDTGLYVGGKITTALWLETGVIAGLRPQYRYLANSDFPYTLRWDDFNVFIHNTNEVTLNLPSSPAKGQTAHIIKTGSGLLKINCNGNSVWLNGGNKTGTFGLTSYNAFIVLFFYGSSNCVMSLHVED